MTNSADIAGLESVLGHKFVRPELLLQALTHRSVFYERVTQATDLPRRGTTADNERLEFLGDAVLGLIVAEELFKKNPEAQEGDLTRLNANLVSRKHLGEVGLSFDLGAFMLLGRGLEQTGGRKKPVLVANCLEAVVAALFLDGGLDCARRFAIERILGDAADQLAQDMRSGSVLGNHKAALQEHTVSKGAGLPVYTVVNESGPGHSKQYSVELQLRSKDGALTAPLSRGNGNSKKKAEQEAARRALAKLSSGHQDSTTSALNGNVIKMSAQWQDIHSKEEAAMGEQVQS